MDKTKKIKFDFTDEGSLNKLRTEYDKFTNAVIDKSKNYGGGSTVQQNKFIKDEINHYQQLYEIQKKTFDLKEQEYRKIQAGRAGTKQMYDDGFIGPNTFAKYNKTYDSAEKDLLRGTGRRKWENYAGDQEFNLADNKNYTTRLEKLLDGSNVLLRQILGQDKDIALETIKAIDKNDEASPEERLAASQARDILNNRKDAKKEPSILSQLFTYQGLNNLLGSAKSTLTANSGLEATRNLFQTGKDAAISAADVVAGIAESYLGKKAGKIVGTTLRAGSRIAGLGADVAMDDMFSAYESRQGFDATNFSNRALTGRNLDNYTMSGAGYGLNDFAGANGRIARAMGNSRGSEGQTSGALNLERGFGISQDISAGLLELIRTNKETDKNLVNIVGGIYSSGKSIFNGDRTYLGEFITKNFSTLQRDLLRNQTSVSSGTVMDVLTQFNSVGGQFDARHQNSMGLISSINNSLTNPGGDAMDAITFAALRKSMPGSGIGDVLREREKGLSSPTYLKAVMQQLEMMGGSEDMQMINLSKAFGINYNAATDLLRNKDKIGNMSEKELKNYFIDMGGLAQGNTTTTQRQSAELDDAKIKGDWAKMFQLIEHMGQIIETSFSGATYTIDPASGKLSIAMPAIKKPPVKQGATSQTKSDLGAAGMHTW